MHYFFICLLVLGITSRVLADAGPDAEITANLPGVSLTLIAEQPAIVTPTGIDVDAVGNVWAVACHTHFRPGDYAGPEHDEVLVFAADGSRQVFYEQTTATMDLELGPEGFVYLAERSRLLRVRDTDGDGSGDEEQLLATLQTEADYPHNGLSGLAWAPDGDLLFSLGENFAEEWTLTGVDGTSVKGTGEGGIFRCRADGTGLRRIARGLWNPFGLAVRADGTIFAAENDPGARPPCRLLHIVQGGDYGYQRAYGKSPFHPFVCWNGELPGTLPMIHSVGEAPCGVAVLGNGLIVPSWADNRIDFYPLRPAGASFTTERRTLVAGNDTFRPVGIAAAGPTRFYLTDWVDRSYELHGLGRLWRLDIDPDRAEWIGSPELPPPTAAARLAERLRAGGSQQSDTEVVQLARSDDPFLSLAAIDAWSQRLDDWTPERAVGLSPEDQARLILAVRRTATDPGPWLPFFWAQPANAVRFELLRWIADEQLQDQRPRVEALLRDAGLDYQIFEACLATLNSLAGKAAAGITDEAMLLERISNPEVPPRIRSFAFRLLDPGSRQLTAALLTSLVAVNDRLLTREVIRSLAVRGDALAQQFLRQLASDTSLPVEDRADAIAGLVTDDPDSLPLLMELAGANAKPIREEALRSLRFGSLPAEHRVTIGQLSQRFPESADLIAAVVDPNSLQQDRPPRTDTRAWQQRLTTVGPPADPAAGRRIFHHSQVGGCIGCHRHTGRGGAVGPDLSIVALQDDEQHLLQALLEPSRDVAPQYHPRMLVTERGEVFTGLLLRKGGRSGREFYRDAAGHERSFLKTEIVERREVPTSMMPAGLIDRMTDREIRDLLAFLGAVPTARGQTNGFD